MRERDPGVGLDGDVLGVGVVVLDEQLERLGRVQDAAGPVGRGQPETLSMWLGDSYFPGGTFQVG